MSRFYKREKESYVIDYYREIKCLTRVISRELFKFQYRKVRYFTLEIFINRLVVGNVLKI